MASPIVTVNGSATAGGVNVAAGATVTIQLTDLTCSTWSITCIGTDDVATSPVLTVNQITRTATFTAGALGSAYILRSQVNNGVDANGAVNGGLVTTFGVYVLTANAKRVMALNETQEGNVTAGWVASANVALRARDGVSTIAMPDADYVVTAAQYGCRILYVTGALTAARGFTLPHDGWWRVVNATTGGWSLTVKGPTGGSVSVGAGSTAVFSDGVNFHA